MHIAIPSKGRAGKVKSLALLSKATLYVPEYELSDYESIYGKRVIGVPSDIRGITPTRNWILDNCKDNWVVMVDDDVRIQGWFKLLDGYSKTYPLTEEEWYREFVRLFDLTQQMGYRIWGTNTDGQLMSFYPYKPILFQTYVTASMMGIRNDTGIRFDERFTVKEDYEMCLRCIKEDGGLIGARYIYWVNSHWKDEGGCKDYRTVEVEERCVNLLKELYPGFISKMVRKDSEYTISLNF